MDHRSSDRAAVLRHWCVVNLGSQPVETFFTARSMSQVSGVVLADGRRVALKVRETSDRVLACARAQRIARDRGIDCPALLAGPERLEGVGWLSAETWRAEGTSTPPGDPVAAYIDLLQRLVRALAGLDAVAYDPPPPWAHYDHRVPGRVWPPAASPRWDPEVGGRVPVGLRSVAAAARERLLAADLPAVVGHTDLNGLNVRWAPGPIVHDWDSLAGLPESVLVGIVAVNHAELPGAGRIATVADTERALERYRSSRPFSHAETEVAWAAGVWVAAYNAAFEHLHGAPGAVSAELVEDASERLRLAGV